MKRGNQVGGGDLYAILGSTVSEKARITNLQAKITASPIPDIKNILNYWFSDKRNAKRDGKIDTKECPDVVKTYFVGIEHQDELFDIVIDILKEVYAKGDILTNAVEIDTNKVAAMEYVSDIEQYILFKKDKTEVTTASEQSKLDKIMGPAGETLSELLMYPKRLNNVFIQSLANIFILFKAKREILTQIKTPALRGLAVAEYKANLYSNVWLLTSNEFRDGFFLDQSDSAFKTSMDTFWLDLFKELANIDSLSKTDFALEETGWHFIAAHVFKWYLSFSFTEDDHKPALLKYFIDQGITDTEGFDRPNIKGMRLNIPSEQCDNEKIFGTTLTQLFTIMDNTTLEFILHLAYTIRKNEAETLTEIQAQTSSPENGAAAV
jgi:hypothetical protein